MNDELSMLSLDDLERVDVVCDAFVASWERGERPSLEDLISNAPESLRRAIALELIQSEVECRRRAGESPNSNEYAQRFPEWALEVESRIAEPPQTAESNLEVTQQFIGSDDNAEDLGSVVSTLVESSTEPMIVSPRDLPIAAESLSDYQIRGVVGKGGMGVVVRARDKKLNRDVAIKFLVPELARHQAARERFLREARAAAAVRHDNVVTIYSVREVDGVPLLEMELIQGESLAERIQRTGPMSALEVARLAIQIARGLDAAHKKGLIHRDIKPGNILLEATEEATTPLVSGAERVFSRAKITDFGLARVISEESLTNSGLIAGTPQYMSPEQAEGKGIDRRSDLFSLGSVMYAMCAGRAPFHADSALGVLRQVSDFAPPSLHERNRKIPGWLLTVIERLMAKKPDDRFQSAGEVVEALSREYEIASKSPESKSGPSLTPGSEPVTAATVSGGAAGWVRLVATALLPIALFAAVFIIRTSKGEFVLTTQDPGISAQINAAGGLVVENKATKASYTLMPGLNRLPNGDYELIVTAPDGLELTTSRFQLRRFGGSVNATVTARPLNGAGAGSAARVEPKPLEMSDIAVDSSAPSENQAIRFDGEKSYVSIPDLSRNGTVPYTLEAWILPSYRDEDEAVIVISGEAVLQLGKGYRGFYPIESDIPVAHDMPVKTPQSWVHVAIVVELNEVRFYVNGKISHQLPRLNQAGFRYRFRGTWLGAHPNLSDPDSLGISYFFQGYLDEIRMSSVARYRDEFVPATQFECDVDTLALYHCDEGSGHELRDSSGHNHHGLAFDLNWDRHDIADKYAGALKLQEQAAEKYSLPLEITNQAGMTLRLIPPGEFLMGAPEDDVEAAPEEKPQHLVRLSRPFYMATTEVTVGQFRKFVDATGYVTEAESDGQGAFMVSGPSQTRSSNMVWHRMDEDRDQKDDTLPVRSVSWEDARRFCEWLSQSESKIYRLPTEAEWEYACRAGTTTRFSFGDRMDEFQAAGRVAGQSGPLHRVAEFPPNPFGLFDMHGNLNEICLDSELQYTSEIAIDPVGSIDPAQPSVVRGGACSSPDYRLRSSQRYLNDSRSFPELNFATIVKGFRVVAVAKEDAGK
ncbi:MAG: SUMF1/EgtB/PvdO family nonheme iron enzyme [Planctomycetaceae bacterium]